MALNLGMYSPRSLFLIMLAGFAGLGLWALAPWSGPGGGSGSGNGGSSTSAAAPSAIKVDGPVQVESSDDVVTGLVVPLTLSGGDGIAFDGARLRAETAMSDTAVAAVPATFSVAWSDGNGDSILDAGEHAVLTVTLPQVSTVHPDNPLRLVVTAARGATVAIEDVLP